MATTNNLSQEEIDQQLTLLKTYRRTLAYLLQQAAHYGGEAFAPIQVVNGIHGTREHIWDIKARLRANGMDVEDGPSDEQPAQSLSTTRQRQRRIKRSDGVLLRDYLSRLHASCNALAFGDPMSERLGRPMELANVFTMPYVNEKDPVIATLAEIRDQACVLLGEPGSGKTTVLAFLGLAQAEAQPLFIDADQHAGLARLGSAWHRVPDASAPFPVRIRLRNVVQSLWEGVPEVQDSDLTFEEHTALIALLEQRLCAGDKEFQRLMEHLDGQCKFLQKKIDEVKIEADIALKRINSRRELVEVEHQQVAKLQGRLEAIKRSIDPKIEQIESQIRWLKDKAAMLLLDGLDEVSEERLPTVQKLIGDALIRFKRSRIVISCRTFDYRNEPSRRIAGLPELVLRRFDQRAQEEFVTHWYDELVRTGRRIEVEAKSKQNNLRYALHEREELSELAQTPLLLALIALVHTEEGELPPARALLYQRCVRLLLARWRPPSESDVELNEGRLLTLAEELGYRAHVEEQHQGKAFRGLSRTQIRGSAEEFFARGAQGEEARRKAESIGMTAAHRLLDSNGLLLPVGDDYYSFAHRTFQEFLAGQYLGISSRRRDLVLRYAVDPHWHVALLLMAGYGAREGNSLDYLLMIIDALVSRGQTERIMAAEMLREIGEEVLRDKGYSDVLDKNGLWQKTFDPLFRVAFNPIYCSDPFTRNRNAELFDSLGTEERPAINLERSEYWAKIIAPGSFEIGDKLYAIRQPYALARYPVTNHQYLRFLRHIEEEHSAEQARLHRPHSWLGRRYPSGRGSHPVEGVGWDDACLFARWADWLLRKTGIFKKGEQVRLPTEPEWERAAAYHCSLTPGMSFFVMRRNYPWGSVPNLTPMGQHEPGRQVYANTSESGIGQTTVVGIFPQGAADCGAEDLAGNVWEWCSTPYCDYPLPENLMPESIFTHKDYKHKKYTIRGGSWRSPQSEVSCTYRSGANYNADIIGFRLVRVFLIQG